jgi:hypothetical protein
MYGNRYTLPLLGCNTVSAVCKGAFDSAQFDKMPTGAWDPAKSINNGQLRLAAGAEPRVYDVAKDFPGLTPPHGGKKAFGGQPRADGSNDTALSVTFDDGEHVDVAATFAWVSAADGKLAADGTEWYAVGVHANGQHVSTSSGRFEGRWRFAFGSKPLTQLSVIVWRNSTPGVLLVDSVSYWRQPKPKQHYGPLSAVAAAAAAAAGQQNWLSGPFDML